MSTPELSVWDAQHPEPKPDDPSFERSLLKWFTDDADKQLRANRNAALYLLVELRDKTGAMTVRLVSGEQVAENQLALAPKLVVEQLRADRFLLAPGEKTPPC